MADLEILASTNLISRKICVIENLCNFHTVVIKVVHSELGFSFSQHEVAIGANHGD